MSHRYCAFASLALVALAAGCGRTSLLYDDALGGAGGGDGCLLGQQEPCYTGPLGTEGIGTCKAGTRGCIAGEWSACVGEVLPAAETCDGIDNDCNGVVDDPCPCPLGQQQPCYSGPLGTEGMGACRAGTQTCEPSGWTACVGEVLPSLEACDGVDSDCNGTVDDGCPCPVGQTQFCYSGPPGTADKGPCQRGKQTCSVDGWGPCVGEVLPSPEVCDAVDNNCDGQVDEGLCPVGYKCGSTITLSKNPIDWSFNGVASFNMTPADWKGILSSGEVAKAGSIVYLNPVVVDTFKLTFQIFVGGNADGLAFMLQTNGPTALGGAVGGLGVSGLDGYAIEFDTHQDACAGEPSQSHVGIDDLSQTCGNGVQVSMFTAPMSVVQDWRSIEIDFDQGKVTVAVEGKTVVSEFTIPGFPLGQPFYVGFAASNWFASSWNTAEVRHVEMTFPSIVCL